MATFFVWIEEFSQPLGSIYPVITIAARELPAGPVQQIVGLQVAEEITARRCTLLRQQNGIQVSVEGEYSLPFIVDRALAKAGKRHAPATHGRI